MFQNWRTRKWIPDSSRDAEEQPAGRASLAPLAHNVKHRIERVLVTLLLTVRPDICTVLFPNSLEQIYTNHQLLKLYLVGCLAIQKPYCKFNFFFFESSTLNANRIFTNCKIYFGGPINFWWYQPAFRVSWNVRLVDRKVEQQSGRKIGTGVVGQESWKRFGRGGGQRKGGLSGHDLTPAIEI